MADLTPLPPPASFRPHALHAPERCWPETNCYADLWIELLAALGTEPAAAFGFGVTQDFEGDQFTFGKPPPGDLLDLFGLDVRELSVHRPLEQHATLQLSRGEIVLLEVDSFHLPDTAATTYRRDHTKTTIAIDTIDPAAKRCTYFHNAARGTLFDADYDGVMRLDRTVPDRSDPFPPYVEIVARRADPLPLPALRERARTLLAAHLRRRPARNPFTAWREQFGVQNAALLDAPDGFHQYAFHFPRLAGANFELLGSHLAWLDPDALSTAVESCAAVARTAKVLQFRLARAVARGRRDDPAECFDALEADWEHAVDSLLRHLA